MPVYGGQKIMAQMKFLKHGPEIVVGTPGRVMDLLERRIINFHNMRFVVLDEVDRMLDIGFRDDIRNILSQVKGDAERPDAPTDARSDRRDAGANGEADAQTGERQRAGRSADADRSTRRFSSRATISRRDREARRGAYMREPVEKLIAPGADDKPTVEKVEQYYSAVQPWDKYRLLRQLLEQENPDLAIVFCRTKHGAREARQEASRRRHRVPRDPRQPRAEQARPRDEGFPQAGSSTCWSPPTWPAAASTSPTSAHIINYDIPDDPEVYVHRVGRTARMGSKARRSRSSAATRARS